MQPPYVQIAAELRDAIQTGSLPVGTRLPSARALRDKYKVAMEVVHHAIALLVSEGLVETKPRLGSWVISTISHDKVRALREQVADLQARLARAEERLAAIEKDLAGRPDH